MKSEFKKALCFLFFVVTYSLQAIVDVHPFSYLYFGSFLIAISFLYIIKNKYLGVFIGILTLFVTEFYDSNYKFITFSAFLLFCAHKNLIDTKNDNNKNASSGFSFICVQLSLFATIALFIYNFILLINAKTNTYTITKDFSRAYCIFLWLTGVFIYSLIASRGKSRKNSHTKINKDLSNNLRFIYLVSIFAFAATVLYTYAKIGYINVSYNAIYFPWFVYICSMIYNGDPYIESMAKSIEKMLTEFSYKDKVTE